MTPTEQEILYKPSMDRANKAIRDSWAYDPTEFLEPDPLTEVERTSWPSKVGVSGLIILALAAFLAPVAPGAHWTGVAFAGIFSGWSLFGLANYLAYRTGERVWIQPDTAGRIVVAGFFLTLTALVAAFIN
jgi:hypothetical protein